MIYLGLDTADDAEVRRYAEAHGFTLVTKNTDMVDLCLVKGPPPKVLWLRVGNCSRALITEVLDLNEIRIRRFAEAKSQTVLSLFRLAQVETEEVDQGIVTPRRGYPSTFHGAVPLGCLYQPGSRV